MLTYFALFYISGSSTRNKYDLYRTPDLTKDVFLKKHIARVGPRSERAVEGTYRQDKYRTCPFCHVVPFRTACRLQVDRIFAVPKQS